jgi:hypothetical protein
MTSFIRLRFAYAMASRRTVRSALRPLSILFNLEVRRLQAFQFTVAPIHRSGLRPSPSSAPRLRRVFRGVP